VNKKKAGPAPRPSARPAGGPKAGGAKADSSSYPVEAALEDLRSVIEAADQLAAEVRTATLLVTAPVSRRAEAERFAASLIAAAARWDNRASAAAFCRILMVLGTATVKKMASGALREITAGGVYPPDWVAGIGKPAPGQAWRRYDVFGDDEAIVVTYSYGETRFAALAMIDLTMAPVAVTIGIAADPDKLIAGLEGNRPFERWEEISLAQARRHLEGPLARATIRGYRELSRTSAAFLPVVRTYARRLPEGGEADAPAYAPADRAAAVADFLASPQAAELGAGLDARALRFWAQALTGYSGRVPGEPPAQVGPRKLVTLLGHVANTFTLTGEQLAAMRPAVTAWTTWAAARQGLDPEATAQLLASLPKALDGFAASYDDPRSAVARAYLRDVAASDAEVTELAVAMTRRSLAVPFPDINEAGRPATDVADLLSPDTPSARAALVAAEFASCQLDDGQTSQELIGEATRVVEELWSGEPDATWDGVRRLVSEGRSRHDAIHAFIRHGSS
jgi:hypothetical protein